MLAVRGRLVAFMTNLCRRDRRYDECSGRERESDASGLCDGGEHDPLDRRAAKQLDHIRITHVVLPSVL